MESSKKFRLVALDLDGTTLDADHQLSNRTIEVLRDLSRRGVMIAIATGRSSNSVMKYVDLLKLQQDLTPMVVFNGSVCLMYHNAASRVEELFSTPIDPSAARLLIDLVVREELVAQLYNGTTGEVYAKPCSAVHTELLLRYERLVGKAQVVVQDYEDAHQCCPAGSAKMLVLTHDPDAFMQTCSAALPTGLFHMIRGSPDPFFVEFLRPQSNKGTALATLCEHLGVPLKQTIAFGDGENDIEMLTCAGLGVAMKNARPAVKQAANVVSDFANYEDGVAIQLEKFLALGYLDVDVAV